MGLYYLFGSEYILLNFLDEFLVFALQTWVPLVTIIVSFFWTVFSTLLGTESKERSFWGDYMLIQTI